MDKILSDLYYSISSGYKRVEALYDSARKIDQQITKSRVKKWLEKQPTYTIHKFGRKKYLRNKVIVSSIDEQWQADLNDLVSLIKYNNGYRYSLTCIDLFCKYGWAVPLKTKKSDEIIGAFENIFKTGRKPYKLQTDKGTEFINKQVQKVLKSEYVDFFTTNSEMKASVVERFNRTIKERMWKVFTHKNT